MSNLIPFHFEGAAVRINQIDAEPWFVLADVCAVLEIGNPSMAASRLDADEKGISIVDTLGGPQEATTINESGLYSLVLTSRKPAAKRFKKWVTSEVLPSIRKTGHYGADPIAALSDPATMRGLLLTYTEKVLALESKVGELAPKANALDRIADADGSMCITDAAKHLQIKPKALFDFLDRNGWTYRRMGTTARLGYQPKVQAGYLTHKVVMVQREDGTDKIVESVRVTAKGIAKLAALVPGVAQ